MKELKRPETTGEDISTPEKSEELISLLDEYVDQLESERDELKKYRDDPIDWKGLLMDTCKQCGYPQSNKEYKKLEQELQTLKEEINKLPWYMASKYDLGNKGDGGYIEDCDNAILKLKESIK